MENKAEELAKELAERLEIFCEGLAISGDSPSKETIKDYFNELNNYRQSEIDELKKEVKTLTSLAIDYVNQINDFKNEVERLRKEREYYKTAANELFNDLFEHQQFLDGYDDSINKYDGKLK